MHLYLMESRVFIFRPLQVASTHCFPSIKPCDDPVSFANFSLHRHTILTKLSQSVEKRCSSSPYHQLKFDIQHIRSYFTVKIKHIFVIRSSERLEQEDRPLNMSCHVKYSTRINERVASVQRTDIFLPAHAN